MVPKIEAIESKSSLTLAVERMFVNLRNIYAKDVEGKRGKKQVHDADVLRAAVVLTHAALEDSLLRRVI